MMTPLVADGYLHDLEARIAGVDRSTDKETLLNIMVEEGDMFAGPGDWIVCGIKGEIYPLRHDIFEATYEAIE